jgi:DNA-binding XRE family transcriptional regulator
MISYLVHLFRHMLPDLKLLLKQATVFKKQIELIYIYASNINEK